MLFYPYKLNRLFLTYISSLGDVVFPYHSEKLRFDSASFLMKGIISQSSGCWDGWIVCMMKQVALNQFWLKGKNPSGLWFLFPFKLLSAYLFHIWEWCVNRFSRTSENYLAVLLQSVIKWFPEDEKSHDICLLCHWRWHGDSCCGKHDPPTHLKGFLCFVSAKNNFAKCVYSITVILGISSELFCNYSVTV